MEASRGVKDRILCTRKPAGRSTIRYTVIRYTIYLPIDVHLNWLIIKCGNVYGRGPRY